MRRALLLFNPEATSVSPRVRDVIAHALSSDLKLEVAETKRRHHATHLAGGAAHEGFDLVVVLGGDGTINEAINGLAGTDVPIVPLPGGGTNVFARTLGLPKDPIEATSIVLEKIERGEPPRRVSLGRLNGRAFGFCAGIGLDAAIVRSVERRFGLKKRIGEPFFVMQGLRTFFFAYPRRDDPLRLTAGAATYTGLRSVVACNSSPYTFLGDRPFRLCPDAELNGGLDVLALDRLRALGTVRVVLRAFGRAHHGSLRHVHVLHDVGAFAVESERPIPYQVDGDFCGEDTTFQFESQAGALSVIA